MTRARFACVLLCLQALVVGVSSVDFSLKFAEQYDPMKFDPRLVGGVNASLEVFPAYTFFGNGECGGILITKNRVLTSAHCVESGHPPWVRVGATNRTDGLQVPVRCAKSHPLFVWPNFQYDIAVLKLSEDIITIETPTLNSRLDYPAQDSEQDLVVAGMGRNTTSGFISDNLQQVVYQFVPEDVCKEIYGDDITRGLHVCAKGKRKGICFGDAGGPLFDELEPRWLVGIASGAKSGCAEFGVPDIYSNVAAFLDWIESQEEDETCNDECQGCLCPAYEFVGRVRTSLTQTYQRFFNF